MTIFKLQNKVKVSTLSEGAQNTKNLSTWFIDSPYLIDVDRRSFFTYVVNIVPTTCYILTNQSLLLISLIRLIRNLNLHSQKHGRSDNMFILLTLILFSPNIIRALSFSSCDGVAHLGIIEFTPIRRMLAPPLNKT